MSDAARRDLENMHRSQQAVPFGKNYDALPEELRAMVDVMLAHKRRVVRAKEAATNAQLDYERAGSLAVAALERHRRKRFRRVSLYDLLALCEWELSAKREGDEMYLATQHVKAGLSPMEAARLAHNRFETEQDMKDAEALGIIRYEEAQETDGGTRL